MFVTPTTTFSSVVYLLGVADGNYEEAETTLGIAPNKTEFLLLPNPQTSELAAPLNALSGPPGSAVLLVLRLDRHPRKNRSRSLAEV